MKAVVSSRYGSPDVLEIEQALKPEPKADEVLIRVHATTVSRTDCGMLRAQPFVIRLFIGFRRPRHTILGMDFAGVVEEVGAGVTLFKPGDQIFGLSLDYYGAHAEYLCVSEKGAIAAMPEGARFEEAVVCEGAWYANTTLRRFGLKPGHRILIYGASGAIGTAAVQLAKFYGAEVTAVVGTRHMELVKSLGADQVIDFTTRDFTQIGETFDFIFDAVGKTTFFRCRRLLRSSGVFAATDVGPWCQNLLLTIWSSLTRSNRVVFPLPKTSKAFVEFLKTRMEAKEFRAVIDRQYPLEAYRHVETGQKTGIVVITVKQAIANTQM